MGDKPRVLVLGGVGFIGRNIVCYLAENDLASKIRVADKVLPQTAYLTARQKAVFEKVEFKQGNLVNPGSIAKVFADDDGKFDVVINAAAETKYSQTDEVYEEKVLMLTKNCAAEAAKQGVGVFVEISTAQVYDGDKKASAETSKIKPWTKVAKFKLKCEEACAATEGLNYIIVRPVVVYGSSDQMGLVPRLVVGAVYKHLGETMKLLWNEKLRMNTVHVDDVAMAIWHLATTKRAEASKQIYNIVDNGNSCQESITNLVCEIFGIKASYYGTLQSKVAEKVGLKSLTEDVNDKHLQPWSEMCKVGNVENSPLTPYLDVELLYNNQLEIDGSKLKAAGYEIKHTAPTKEALVAVLEEYIASGLFPKGILA